MERSTWLHPALEYPSCQFNQYASASISLNPTTLASGGWNESEERGNVHGQSQAVMTHSAFTSVAVRPPQGYLHPQTGLATASSPSFGSPFAKASQETVQTPVYKPHIYKPPWIQATQGKDSAD
jgi:hypothetical protein